MHPSRRSACPGAPLQQCFLPIVLGATPAGAFDDGRCLCMAIAWRPDIGSRLVAERVHARCFPVSSSCQ